MPLYEYECERCGHRFEVIQKFSDPLVEVCPVCSGPVRKLASSPAIQFKGSGWYITDYAKKGAGGAADGTKGEKADKGDRGDKGEKASKSDKGDSAQKPAQETKTESTAAGKSAKETGKGGKESKSAGDKPA